MYYIYIYIFPTKSPCFGFCFVPVGKDILFLISNKIYSEKRKGKEGEKTKTKKKRKRENGNNIYGKIMKKK